MKGSTIALMAAAGAALLAFTGSAGAAELEDYPPHPRGEFGPVWGNRRPPGLPERVRGCSAEGAALGRIRQIGSAVAETFVQLVEGLARTESGAMLGRPANNFDARPPFPKKTKTGLTVQALSDLAHKPRSGGAGLARTALKAAGWGPERIDALAAQMRAYRPLGDPLITAWGVFQWNRPAMADAGHMAAIGIPGPRFSADAAWRLSPTEEIDGPLEMYRQIWAWARARGASERDAARAVRIWHQSSAAGRSYLERGAASRAWAQAWAQVPGDRRGIVDRHLRTAGIA